MACHQLSSCNKWSLAVNMETVQPSNRPQIFLQGRKTCLNNEPCRAQADHKYFKFLLPLLVTQTPLVCHLMPGLGCVTCSSSSASVGSWQSFTHQPVAAALIFSSISHVQPCFCFTLLYSWRGHLRVGSDFDTIEAYRGENARFEPSRQCLGTALSLHLY